MSDSVGKVLTTRRHGIRGIYHPRPAVCKLTKTDKNSVVFSPQPIYGATLDDFKLHYTNSSFECEATMSSASSAADLALTAQPTTLLLRLYHL
jgi:hypothetical protein